MRRCSVALALVLMCSTYRTALGDGSVDSMRVVLLHLQQQTARGEVVLRGGQRLTVQVDAVLADSVVVREQLGPLYQQFAVYALEDVASVSALLWPPRQVQPPAAPLSLPTALGLEVLLPGAGYMYAGETGTALSLAGMAIVATVTALATGTDGAAAWVPALTWMKIASVLNLRDQVRAINRSGDLYHGRVSALHRPDAWGSSTPRDVFTSDVRLSVRFSFGDVF